jgi:hypothetical protein
MMRRYKILLLLATLHIGVAGCYVACPQVPPKHKKSYKDAPYYKEALLAIEQNGQLSSHGSTVGRFRAGWASRAIVPPKATPLAGYGGRWCKRSKGVHDEVFVKALAVCDGPDKAVIVGADMLMIPENIAEAVRVRVSERTELTANEILFNASHNHSGPGAFAPGVGLMIFNGPYDRKVSEFLAGALAEAIVEACQSLEPAKVTGGDVDAPEYIKNRTRSDAPVDSELSYMLIEQEDGDRCFVVSYSAHPTILNEDNMEFTAEYPGFLMRRLKEEAGAEAIYLGGAVGSMSPKAPDADNRFDRSRAMGEALADKVLEAVEDAAQFENEVDVASIGVPIELPRYDVRLTTHWRMSRFLLPLLGIDSDGWMHAVRIGDIVLVGTPADYCGEISVDLKSRAQDQSIDLWVLSFNGDYLGYISPDKYYYDLDEEDGYGYERGVMSWVGPDQEAITVSLIAHMLDTLFPEPSGNP